MDSVRMKSTSSRVGVSGAEILALLLPSSVIMGELLNLSVSQFPPL